MIKRLCVYLSLVMILCSLSGCQSLNGEHIDNQTESQTVVETVADNVFESESFLYQTSQRTITEMVKAPEQMVYSLSELSEKTQVDFIPATVADIELPDTESMSVVQLKSALAEDEVKRIQEQISDFAVMSNSEAWTRDYKEYTASIVENVELLSFDRIETVIEDLIVEDLQNDKLDTALTRDSITNICLEYGYVHDKETDSHAIVPVWNCYGDSDSGELKVLTINAIDGSVLFVDKNTVADAVQAPERMLYSVGDFEIDAEIILPDVAGMDVVAFEIDAMETEEISKLVSMYMTDEFAFFDDELIKLSIDVVNELEDTWSLNKLIEDVNKEEAKNADEEKQYPTLEADEEDYLNNYEIVLGLLQAEECAHLPGFRYSQVEKANGEVMDLYVAFIESDDRMGAIFAGDNELIIYVAEKTSLKDMMQYLVLVYINVITKSTVESTIYIVDYEVADENKAYYYLSELAPIANLNYELLNDLNYIDYKQMSYNPSIYYNKADSFSEYSVMSYAKGYDHIPILGMGNSKYRICNKIDIGREHDQLWTLSVYPVISLGDVQSEFVDLLPFSQIESNIHDYMNSENFKVENEFVTGQIESIRLEYMTVFDEIDDAGNIIPVWNFYYANPVTDKNGDVVYKENRYWLSVNAMDGTIIR